MTKIVLDLMQSAANHSPNAEVGGLLLGQRKERAIFVTLATLPARLDVCEKYAFHRKDPLHQIIATKEWLCSGFKTDWVGEWHSHPERYPFPSSVDIETWKTQTSKRHATMNYVIVGTRDDWIGLFDPVTLTPHRLSLVEETEETLLFYPAAV